jgi:hypothetical protein
MHGVLCFWVIKGVISKACIQIDLIIHNVIQNVWGWELMYYTKRNTSSP